MSQNKYGDPMQVPYTYVTDTAGAVLALQEMAKAQLVSFDTETEVLPNTTIERDGPGDWVVLSASARFVSDDNPNEVIDKTWVINMSDVDPQALVEPVSVLEPYAWNAAFERRVFLRAGLRPARWVDPMLFEAVLRQGVSVDGKNFYRGLKDVADHLLSVEMSGKGDIQLSFRCNTVLTDEQKGYAAQDAIVVLWLEPILRAQLAQAGLTDTAMRECAAMGSFQDFTLNGLWLDKEAWLEEVKSHEVALREVDDNLASLTNGGQANLFDSLVELNWNPNSPIDVRNVLNEFNPEEVKAYTAAQSKTASERLLDSSDSVDHDALVLIGSDISKKLVEHAEHQKVVTTYGSEFVKLAHDDERFHARYLQALTATGRASSDKPNFQNLTPLMKPFLRPTPASKPVHQLTLQDCLDEKVSAIRVFVAVDLSQAELRTLAYVSKDEVMINAYVNGDDLHLTTAARMFGIDFDTLKADYESGDAEAAKMRKKGKTLNFGVVYGLAAASLARNLSVEGVPTTTAEASELLRLYDEAYPGVAAWLAQRDAYVRDLSNEKHPFDWDRTWALHTDFKKVKAAKFRFRDIHKRFPSLVELADTVRSPQMVASSLEETLGHTPTPDEIARAQQAHVDHIRWVAGFQAPVVLLEGGVPFTFESRTVDVQDASNPDIPVHGRRRVFDIPTDLWVHSMMQTAAQTKKPRACAVRDEWAAANNVSLLASNKPLSREVLKKRFDGAKGKALKESFVRHVLEEMGPQAAAFLQEVAAADTIRSFIRRFRNHPIQGSVADAVEDAMGLLEQRLSRFDSAKVVQSVHDSLVVEVDVTQAVECAQVIKSCMEEGLSVRCPGVPVIADVEILASLDPSKHLLDENDLAYLCKLSDELSLSLA